MLRDIIRKEIMDNISTLKFVVTFAVVTVLIISGLAIGTKDYIEKRNEARLQPQRNQESLSVQSDWLTAGYIGLAETKRPYVLNIIDHGIDNSLGRSADVSLGLDATFDKSRNLIAPILAIFGEVDLTFIVKIILSLFVILLTFDSISGEKENGTLKLTIANPVRRSTVILGKIIGGYSVILVAFILPLLLGLAFLMGFYPEILSEFNGEAWARFGIIVVIYLIYLALFFSVGLFISALCQKSSTSFIVLLMIWVLFVTIIPRLSLTVAERLSPYDSYVSMQTMGVKEMAEKRGELTEKFQDQAMWMKAAQEGTMAQMFASIFEGMADQQQEIMKKYDEEFAKQQNRQINTAEPIARSLSPTSALTFAVQSLAGSGYERQKEYTRQLREFQKTFRQLILDKMSSTKIRSANTFQEDLFLHESLDVKMSEITFHFREESFNTVLGRSIMDIGVLAIMALMFFSMASVAILKYDVR